jgi:D-alanyl-D-alanine carboxypeptidase
MRDGGSLHSLVPRRALPPVMRMLARVVLALVVLGLGLGTFAQWQVRQNSIWVAVEWALTTGQPLEDQIGQSLSRETRANPHIPGQLIYVGVPALGLERTFAAGEGVRPDDDVRVASNIKPFVAAAALKLVEEGRLTLDGPIEPFLSAPVVRILRDDKIEARKITLRQLLNHTSGLADYGDALAFQVLAYVPTAIGLAPHWSAEQQIWFAAHFTPRGPIGTRFRYSDTNYLLAADMIAKAMATPNRATALRALMDWDRLGARETYWEQLEPEPEGTRRVRQFRGAIEDTHLDVSFDLYGGGGLVMSTADLGKAHRAVVRGLVFKDPARTLALMQTPGRDPSAGGYGLGISPIPIAGETCWAHGGRWGTIAIHCPASDITIARSWGQSNAGGGDQIALLNTLAGLARARSAPPKEP